MIITRPPRILSQVARLFLLILLLSSAIMSLARLQDPRPPWIAFTRNHDGYTNIYRMRFDGSQRIKLTNPNHHTDHHTQPSWSNDGKWLGVTSQSDVSWDIFRMRPDGSDFQPLIGNVFLNEYESLPRWNAQWSPNGEWILFTSIYGTIFRMRPDGTDLQQLTDYNYSHRMQPYIQWSPDGQQIIFVPDLDNELYNRIYRMNADGSEQIVLADNKKKYGSPIWSPDGEWVLFIEHTYIEPIQSKIYRMRPDGSEQTPYLEHLENVGRIYRVANSSYILLTIYNNIHYFDRDIYCYNIETGELTQLTHDGKSSSPAPSPIIDLPWRAEVILLLSLALLAFAVPPQALYKSLKRR